MGANYLFRIYICFFVFFSVSLSSIVIAKEQIIQNEKMSFELCLEVIKLSSDKLSIAPELSDSSGNQKVAIFTLSDGKLKITCDKSQGLLTVVTY